MLRRICNKLFLKAVKLNSGGKNFLKLCFKKTKKTTKTLNQKHNENEAIREANAI